MPTKFEQHRSKEWSINNVFAGVDALYIIIIDWRLLCLELCSANHHEVCFCCMKPVRYGTILRVLHSTRSRRFALVDLKVVANKQKLQVSVDAIVGWR